MFAKQFFHAILVSLAVAEITGMVPENLQCPASQVELSDTEWGM